MANDPSVVNTFVSSALILRLYPCMCDVGNITEGTVISERSIRYEVVLVILDSTPVLQYLSHYGIHYNVKEESRRHLLPDGPWSEY